MNLYGTKKSHVVSQIKIYVIRTYVRVGVHTWFTFIYRIYYIATYLLLL